MNAWHWAHMRKQSHHCGQLRFPHECQPGSSQVPHGSKQDSGFAAAAAYLLLQQQLSTHGTQGQPGLPHPLRCLMLGTNHFTNLPLACLSSAAAWRTPLGDVPLDTGLNAALAEQGLPYDDTPHTWVGLQRVVGACNVLCCAVLQISRWRVRRSMIRVVKRGSCQVCTPNISPCRAPQCSLEHSIENQLPFLQHIMDCTPSPGRRSSSLAIAPVCVGWLGSAQQARRLGDQLLGALRQAQAQHPQQAPPLLIATSDFTHAVSCSCCRRQAVGSDSPARNSAAGCCAGCCVHQSACACAQRPPAQTCHNRCGNFLPS